MRQIQMFLHESFAKQAEMPPEPEQEAPGVILIWTQPNLLKHHFELHSEDGEVFATLHQGRDLEFTHKVFTEETEWIIKPLGVLQPGYNLRFTDQEEPFAICKVNANSTASLKFHVPVNDPESAEPPADELEYFWKSVRRNEQVWRDADKNLLVTSKTKETQTKLGATLYIQPEAAGAEKLPILLVMGFFLSLMAFKQEQERQIQHTSKADQNDDY